jgi:hypothetical protein
MRGDDVVLAMIFPTLRDLKESGYAVSLQRHGRYSLSCNEDDFSLQRLLDDLSVLAERFRFEDRRLGDGALDDV